MYSDNIHVKEVNAYYARRGDLRTSNLKGRANVSGFADYIRKAAASSAQSGKAVQSAAQEDTASSTDAAQSAVKDNGNICCEKCHLTNQLVLQMLSRNLYSQSALGYSTGSLGNWSAYQSAANMLAGNLF